MPRSAQLESPVVFLFFNRRREALRVFNEIRALRPKRLSLVSDGPRASVPGEAAAVAEIRALVERRIDWPADVVRDYAPDNWGCGRRVASGIEAALARYGRAIIVEDDCLPTHAFFEYCDTLLDVFDDNKRILSISGTYFLGRKRGRGNVGFSRFPCIWGWATWARAWNGYDRELRAWDDTFIDEIARENEIPSFLPQAWKSVFAWARAHPESTWDVQFWLLSLKKRGLTAFPYSNQITNIGAGGQATHTTTSRFCNRRSYPFEGPLVPPSHLVVDNQYDRFLQQEFYSNTTTLRNVLWKVLFKTQSYLRAVRSIAVGAPARG